VGLNGAKACLEQLFRPSLFNPHQESHNDDQNQEWDEATHGRTQFALPPRLGQGNANFPTDPCLSLGDSQEPFPGKTAFIHGRLPAVQLAL